MSWFHGYAMLGLRLQRQVSGAAVLIYTGPRQWREQAEREEPPPPAQLADDAEALLAAAPSGYLAAQVRAMRAVARRLAGTQSPLSEYARECLDVDVRWVPHEVLEEAHSRIDAALPTGTGTLTERLEAWRATHTLPVSQIDRLPAIVDRAVAETRRRTSALIPLPEGETVECRLQAGAPFLAAGHYAGQLRSIILVNRDLPFNLADLLYVVAHEGHPGHIAESVLKERSLADRPDQQVRFMLGPSFVISEGLGLHAQDIIFPGDSAQSWLVDNVEGVVADGSDFAALHRARNALFGAWANTAFLAAEGRPDDEVARYLSRWALLTDADAAAALRTIRAPPMQLYVLAYYHGWRLLQPWLETPDRDARVRRLLTEQLLPSAVEHNTKHR